MKPQKTKRLRLLEMNNSRQLVCCSQSNHLSACKTIKTKPPARVTMSNLVKLSFVLLATNMAIQCNQMSIAVAANNNLNHEPASNENPFGEYCCHYF